MLSIMILPFLVHLINMHNTLMYIFISTTISVIIVCIYICYFRIKSNIILMGFTILKYSLYGTLISYVLNKIIFREGIVFIYSQRNVTNNNFELDIIISLISISIFIFMEYKFIRDRIKNKYVYLNKQYRYSIYATISYCIDNIFIAYFIRLIFSEKYSTNLFVYVIVYAVISELIMENILVKAELSYTKYNIECIEKQLDNQVSHYKIYNNYIKGIRRISHDIKWHKEILKKLMKNKNYGDAKEFVDGLDEYIESYEYNSICENVVVDSIIKNTIEICKNDNINFSYNISIGQDIIIKNIHLSIIFNNLLDNAIEACNNIQNREINKYINLNAKVVNGNLVCSIENSKINKVEVDKHMKFKTLKKDKINHGIGIENLKITISKYDGIIDFIINENSFKVNFIIPL
ncbi:GHKL domain-containing protein [Paraclostridium sordellii]|uniref:Sensor histidine kinase n=1 Tax=Paraclostridium sordellii TaxID=1505 RepID=A0A0C7Q1K5_PARSO|nr:GHKL domain-containing protein [Paeniclostridium sordellii]QYE97063.1 GHKL domain-containing protein [Paeniclostridium sordellii]CEN22262.1 sensor histidine kinase [[Clostridium] sordellii] [Paeniclostridium sordellii]CEN79070.1 sensor histidine kinase [[Clostridium] sordellii] [Paeniclostridium sordellii]CEP88587.1 sensor histidine kinase [[Clostridium] sordellii] [Paeniclostridium sordellii]CEP96906.1 sensor histidine kinase [[Clostridium] sordellii] [Paeniclostridium sordellii]